MNLLKNHNVSLIYNSVNFTIVLNFISLDFSKLTTNYFKKNTFVKLVNPFMPSREWKRSCKNKFYHRGGMLKFVSTLLVC